MRPRLYADLRGFLRTACTHASNSGRELPVLPFYVKEHSVGWLGPSFADQLRRWPHVFEVSSAFVTLRATPDTPAGRTTALAEVVRNPRYSTGMGLLMAGLEGPGPAFCRGVEEGRRPERRG